MFNELKKYGIEDLHNTMSENYITLSMLWTLTKEELKDDLGMKLGQQRKYFEAKQKMEYEKCLKSGKYGKF